MKIYFEGKNILENSFDENLLKRIIIWNFFNEQFFKEKTYYIELLYEIFFNEQFFEEKILKNNSSMEKYSRKIL